MIADDHIGTFVAFSSSVATLGISMINLLYCRANIPVNKIYSFKPVASDSCSKVTDFTGLATNKTVATKTPKENTLSTDSTFNPTFPHFMTADSD